MAYRVRRTSRDDWRELRRLRLAALRDPVASVAFYEPYEEALRLTRGEWERRAIGRTTVTFVGVTDTGDWGGMVGVFAKGSVAQVVGVYMRPEHRGTGLAALLMRAAIDWADGREVRLRVHENNPRAVRFYRSLGFEPTGDRAVDPADPAFETYELVLRPLR
ncbi:GNAT family N-acetyltransferase [Streptomyces avicenniae]|uniref:GNAT family N-acetyltransferase n=1 Tax=Streptomyces avicenniae TaxID=500153 RepID=UPI000699BD73|nr:GNAT family N-acetyltransferase [Streptomyces avicenniae]